MTSLSLPAHIRMSRVVRAEEMSCYTFVSKGVSVRGFLEWESPSGASHWRSSKA